MKAKFLLLSADIMKVFCAETAGLSHHIIWYVTNPVAIPLVYDVSSSCGTKEASVVLQ